MSNSNSFIWQHQGTFRQQAQTIAQNVLDELDSNLKPEIFLIGALIKKSADRPYICLEQQEDDFRYNSEDFKNIWNLSEKLINNDEGLQQKEDLLKIEIENCIRVNKKSEGLKTFISSPKIVEDYLVFSLLQLSEEDLNYHYKLSKNEWMIKSGDTEEHYKTNNLSLLYAVISLILELYSQELENMDIKKKDYFGDLPNNKYPNIIQEVGKNLMLDISFKGNFVDPFGDPDFFFKCNTISLNNFTGNGNKGKMVIARKDHPNVTVMLPLNSPISLMDHKAIIKLLETTDENLCLITDTKKAYGLGEVDWDSYDEEQEDLFLIEFVKNNKWVLSHGKDNKMMIVENGIPKLPTDEKLISKAKRNIESIFDDMDDNSKGNILRLIRNILEKKIKALLIISENAKEEAQRLKESSTKSLNPLVFNDASLYLNQISNSYGAVLIDNFSNCLAIGVTLDESEENEDPSKYASYDSAVRYVSARKEKDKDEKCMAIVISKDGDLKPIT